MHQQQEYDLIKAGKVDPDGKELKAISDRQAAVQQQIKQIDAEMAKPSITDQSLSGTSATTPEAAAPGKTLAAIPDEYKKAVAGLREVSS